MNQKIIYISGQITGVENYQEIFKEAELMLKKQYEDAIIVNPAEIVGPPGMTWADYMSIDLVLLKHCTHIYRLDGWEYSNGAIVECNFAHALDLEVIENIKGE